MVVGRTLLRLSSLHKSSGEHLHLWLPLKDRKLRLLYLSCFYVRKKYPRPLMFKIQSYQKGKEEISPSLCFSFWTNFKSDDNGTGNLQKGTTPRSTSKLPMCITGYVFNNIETYQHSFFRFVPQLRRSKTTMRTWLKERSQSLIGSLCSGKLFIWYTWKMLEV